MLFILFAKEGCYPNIFCLVTNFMLHRNDFFLAYTNYFIQLSYVVNFASFDRIFLVGNCVCAAG